MIDQPLQPRTVAASAGPMYRIGNDLVTFKAVAADTNGAYALFEMTTAPGASMPPHRQRYDDETFWVIEGQYTVQLDEREMTLDVGEYLFAPRGTLHGYTNHGITPARMLIFVTPGGIHERFFAEMGERVETPSAPLIPAAPPDLARLRTVAHKYGIEILVPPP